MGRVTAKLRLAPGPDAEICGRRRTVGELPGVGCARDGRELYRDGLIGASRLRLGGALCDGAKDLVRCRRRQRTLGVLWLFRLLDAFVAGRLRRRDGGELDGPLALRRFEERANVLPRPTETPRLAELCTIRYVQPESQVRCDIRGETCSADVCLPVLPSDGGAPTCQLIKL